MSSSDSSMNLTGMALLVLLVLLVANLAISIYVATKVRHAGAEEDYQMIDKRFGKDLNKR